VRAAIRKTLNTPAYRVAGQTGSNGQIAQATVSEHNGKNGRVLAQGVVRGIFVGRSVYIADNPQGDTFAKCGVTTTKGLTRSFDNYTIALRVASRASKVTRSGNRFSFKDIKTANGGKTAGSLTVDGGRIRTLVLSTTVQEGGAPATIDASFRFSYPKIAPITPPPNAAIEVGTSCP
jgi:hypothetical protein